MTPKERKMEEKEIEEMVRFWKLLKANIAIEKQKSPTLTVSGVVASIAFALEEILYRHDGI